jgi:carbon storage regulator CsrA
MLILSRKSQESVVVGGSEGFERLLKVTVHEIGNGEVRLGFDVDAAVPVHRGEVWERILASDPEPDSPMQSPTCPVAARSSDTDMGVGNWPQQSRFRQTAIPGNEQIRNAQCLP